MNGRSARGIKHNLIDLHAQVLSLDPRLPIGPLINPQIEHLQWSDEPFEAYLRRFNEFGAADNRYATYGYWIRYDDLFKLDQHVWSVRRCCRPFHMKLHRSDGPAFERDNIADLIKDRSIWKVNPRPLEELIDSDPDDMHRAAFLSLNVPFAPGDKHRLTRRFTMSHAAPLADWFRLLRASTEDPSKQTNAYAVLNWALENIQFNADDRKKIKQALNDNAAARRRFARTRPPV
jgi:hypothetical protein